MKTKNNLTIKYITTDKKIKDKIDFFLKDWFSSDKTLSVQTSGSTGTPKILQVEKEKMYHSAKMTCDFLGLSSGKTALLCLPLEYISGKMMMVRAIERKLQLVITTPSIQPLNHLTERVDFCAMTPLQVENSLDKLHLINNLIIGGTQVSEKLKQKIQTALREDFPCRVFETYGMSETLSHIALKMIFPHSESYFSPLEGIEITQDHRGCLVIYAPKINSEKLITNDIVEITNERKFTFIGRADNVINSGGAKIFPEQLELQLKKNLTNELCFLGLSDEVLGQKLVLVVEEKDTHQQKEIEKLVFDFPFQYSFHRPKNIIFINEIPRTPNGKVNRIELKKVIKK